MTGFALDSSKIVVFLFSVIISSAVESLFQRPRKRFTSFNPAVFASAST